MSDQVPNPLDLGQSLKRPLDGDQSEKAVPARVILPEDSSASKAGNVELSGTERLEEALESEEPATKRIKLDQTQFAAPRTDVRDKVKGVALVKPE
jgi:hypothetical protein